MVVKVNLNYYKKLSEVIEQTTDELIYELALERKGEKANISLIKVVDEEDFIFKDLLEDLNNIELDEY